MSSHLGNVMSAAEKSSGLADAQVEIKDSASDYESCYNVGHCEPSLFSSTLPVDASVSVLVVMHRGGGSYFLIEQQLEVLTRQTTM